MRQLEFVFVFSPVFGLIANIIAQLLTMRYLKQLGLLRTIYFSFALGLFVTVIIEILQYQISTIYRGGFKYEIFLNLIIYGALGYCYFHFINLGETARRIRILSELKLSGSGKTIEEIIESYNADTVIRKRLDRLISNGQVIVKYGQYYSGKPIVLILTRIYIFLKLILFRQKLNL